MVDQPSSRIEGLSTWRAMLMLLGIVFHATCWHENDPLFRGIVLMSSTFRMGAFFLISGLLAGYSLQRQPPRPWVRRRMVQIGIPAIFGFATLTPVIGILLYIARPATFAPRPIAFDWYHVWFLFALIAYAPLAFATPMIGRISARIDALPRLPGLQAVTILSIAMISLVTMVMVTWMLDQWTSPAYRPPLLQLRLIAGYAPVYVLGLVVTRSAAMRDALIGTVALPVGILALIAASYVWQFAILSAPARDWSNMVLVAGAAFGPPAAGALILKSAFAIHRVPSLLRRLSDASFTMYLLHYPIIIAIKVAMAFVTDDAHVAALCALPVATILSYVAHRTIVRRSPIMALLLNGKTNVMSVRTQAMPIDHHDKSGELLLPGAPRTAGTASVARFGPTALSSEIN